MSKREEYVESNGIIEELSESEKDLDTIFRELLDPFEEDSNWKRVGSAPYDEQIMFLSTATEIAFETDSEGEKRELDSELIDRLKEIEASTNVAYTQGDSGPFLRLRQIPNFRDDLLINGLFDMQLITESELSLEKNEVELRILRQEVYRTVEEYATEYISPISPGSYAKHLDAVGILTLKVPCDYDRRLYNDSVEAISKIGREVKNIYDSSSAIIV